MSPIAVTDVTPGLEQELKLITQQFFGKIDRLEHLGLKTVWKIYFSDGRVLKARIHPRDPRWGRYYPILLAGGVRLPKIVRVVSRDGGDITYTEWIEGVCYKKELEMIPPRHYYLMGAYISSINNHTYEDQRISVHDIVWPQFVIDKDEHLWLIDPENLSCSGSLEKWFFAEILCHKHTSQRQKEAFIEGYLSKYEKRDWSPSCEMVERFVKGIKDANNNQG